ncbi:MAG: FAD:protein FMN transferase [Kiritimatiellae bacterium]|nr:FAD:protein FMN transferase [Kiritimatiellia bacterium]MCO5067422.1 FAD:protein FMN transferase [Kiritimatiellia bacterium]
MRSNRTGTTLAILLLAASLIGCRPPPTRQADLPISSTPAHLAVGPNPSDLLANALPPTRRILENVWSTFNPANRDGEIGKVNRMAGDYRLHISFDTFRALDLADYYGKLTDGAYSFTTGPLRDLWGFTAQPPDEPPSDEVITATLALCDPNTLKLSEQGAISILTPGTRIAPGKLAHAYGTDLAILELRRRELSPVLLTWGNFTRALSAPDDPFSCQVAIPNPRSITNALGTLDLAPNAALAIANLYEETVTIAGQRFGGIIDPHTGRPARGTLLAAVRGPTCTMAHALAQALVVLGPEKGAALFENFPDCEALVIPDTNSLELWMTPGFADHFQRNPAANATPKEWTVSRPAPENQDDAPDTAEPGDA